MASTLVQCVELYFSQNSHFNDASENKTYVSPKSSRKPSVTVAMTSVGRQIEREGEGQRELSMKFRGLSCSAEAERNAH